jgi:hypothetical protein
MFSTIKDPYAAIEIIVAVLFMPINWLLETYKWYLLLNSQIIISFKQCTKAVLGGLAFSMNTPNRLGEYVGRLIHLKEGQRLTGANFSIISGLAQLLVTIIAGIFALLFLRVALIANHPTDAISQFLTKTWVLWVLIFSVILLLFFYFYYAQIIQFIAKIIPIKRVISFVATIQKTSGRLLIYILFISTVRFIIFTTQYLLIWNALGIKFELINGFAIVSLIFLLLAIIPTIAIAELGIRGKVALYVAGSFSPHWLALTAGTILIWFLNLVVPAIVGTFSLWNIKIYPKE